jgi:hypothetical protein
MDVLAAYREVGSYRGAAAICGRTRRSRGSSEAHEAARVDGERVERKGRGHNHDDVADLIAKKVDGSKGRISVKRLLPAARGRLCRLGTQLPARRDDRR